MDLTTAGTATTAAASRTATGSSLPSTRPGGPFLAIGQYATVLGPRLHEVMALAGAATATLVALLPTGPQPSSRRLRRARRRARQAHLRATVRRNRLARAGRRAPTVLHDTYRQEIR